MKRDLVVPFFIFMDVVAVELGKRISIIAFAILR